MSLSTIRKSHLLSEREKSQEVFYVFPELALKKKKHCPSLSIEAEGEVMHWNGSFPVFPETVLSPRRPKNCQVSSFP